MKKILSLLLAVCMLCTLSSCFEIIEEMQLNDNGSGTYTLLINMSESKTKLNSVMSLDSVQGYKVPKKSDIAKHLQLAQQKIAKIPGISEVSSNFDFNNFIGTIKFKFTDVQLVNNAMKLIMDEYKVKNYSIPTYYYNKASKQLVRNFKTQTETVQQYNKLKKEDKEIFQKAKFTSIYKFQSEVAQQENKAAQIAKNKKAVMQQANIHPIITNQTSINQRITLQ